MELIMGRFHLLTEIMNKMSLSEEQLSGINQWLISRILLSKIGRSEDVAKILASCAEGSTFITRAEIVMDGGQFGLDFAINIGSCNV